MSNYLDPVVMRVKNTIDNYSMLEKVGHVVLGFSGGPDSICLFDVLHKLSEEMDFTLHAVHINHGLRKPACDLEQEFCRNFSEERGVEFTAFEFDCEEKAKEWGFSTEEAGRRFRYDSFVNVADRIFDDKNPGVPKSDGEEAGIAIALAHNSDDMVETLVMRILRGTGTDGLAGIPYVRDIKGRGCYRVIRPLLDVAREEIEDYCHRMNLDPRIDETNSEPIYRRNQIRLELIPELEKYNPNFKAAIGRLARTASEDRMALEKLAKDLLGRACLNKDDCARDNGEPLEMDVEILKSELPAIRKRTISLALKEIGLKEDVGYEHLSAVDELIFSESPSAKTNLPKGYYAARKYGKLLIGMASASENLDHVEGVEPEITIEFSEMSYEEYLSVWAKKDADNRGTQTSFAAFDRDELAGDFGEDFLERLTVRNRLPGDEMKLAVGTKKLQDLLVDDKVPKAERDKAVLLALGNRVLWLIPYGEGRTRWCHDYRPGEDTKRVILAHKIEK